MITLHRLDRAQLHRLEHLRLRPGQQRFVGSGAQMIRDTGVGVTFHEVRAPAGNAVGMFKLDPLYFERHEFATPQDVGLRGLLIDAAAQGQGYGSAALDALADHVRAVNADRSSLVLTVNTTNPVARYIYLRAGFRDRGEKYFGGSSGPQHVLWLTLR